MITAAAISRMPTLLLLGAIVVPVSSLEASRLVIRQMKYRSSETEHPTVLYTSTLAPDTGSDDVPPFLFGFLLPLISASAVMWALHRNKQLCCSQDTVNDETIPSEIILESNVTQKGGCTEKEDIELQSVVGGRAGASLRNDPVVGSSLLNESDWTDENDEPKEGSFSWMENSSAAKYHYLND